jgi:hypothetical protein
MIHEAVHVRILQLELLDHVVVALESSKSDPFAQDIYFLRTAELL